MFQGPVVENEILGESVYQTSTLVDFWDLTSYREFCGLWQEFQEEEQPLAKIGKFFRAAKLFYDNTEQILRRGFFLRVITDSYGNIRRAFDSQIRPLINPRDLEEGVFDKTYRQTELLMGVMDAQLAIVNRKIRIEQINDSRLITALNDHMVLSSTLSAGLWLISTMKNFSSNVGENTGKFWAIEILTTGVLAACEGALYKLHKRSENRARARGTLNRSMLLLEERVDILTQQMEQIGVELEVGLGQRRERETFNPSDWF